MTKIASGLEMETRARRFLELSQERFYNGYSILDWPELEELLSGSDLFMSEELISLIGTDIYAKLDSESRRKLGFYEILNFFSMNIHGERYLIAGLARHIHSPGTTTYSPYIHAFIDEENKHMYMFSSFCLRYGKKIYPSKKANFNGTSRRELEALLFFTRVLIFEEIVDYHNAKMKDDPKLNPLIREINRIHHDDEIYHIAFGRDRVKKLITELKETITSEELIELNNYFSEYLQATLREFFNPDVYRDACLPDPYDLRKLALVTPERYQIHQAATLQSRTFLGELGLLPVDITNM